MGKARVMLIAEAEKLLDAGSLEMLRPWGDYVPMRRRGNTFKRGLAGPGIPVFMEAEVSTNITSACLRFSTYIRVRK